MEARHFFVEIQQWRIWLVTRSAWREGLLIAPIRLRSWEEQPCYSCVPP